MSLNSFYNCTLVTFRPNYHNKNEGYFDSVLNELESRFSESRKEIFLDIHNVINQLTIREECSEIVICNDESLDLLYIIAKIFVDKSFLNSNIYVINSTGNPQKIVEKVLLCWNGGRINLLQESADNYINLKRNEDDRPDILNLIGYPIDRVKFIYDPLVRNIKIPEKISFLAITNENYPSNLKAIEILLEKVVANGIIIIEKKYSKFGEMDLVSNLISKFHKNYLVKKR